MTIAWRLRCRYSCVVLLAGQGQGNTAVAQTVGTEEGCEPPTLSPTELALSVSLCSGMCQAHSALKPPGARVPTGHPSLAPPSVCSVGTGANESRGATRSARWHSGGAAQAKQQQPRGRKVVVSGPQSARTGQAGTRRSQPGGMPGTRLQHEPCGGFLPPSSVRLVKEMSLK